MFKKIFAQIALFVTFVGLWQIGNLADKNTNHPLDGGAFYTPAIIFGSIVLIICSLYLGQKSKE